METIPTQEVQNNDVQTTHHVQRSVLFPSRILQRSGRWRGLIFKVLRSSPKAHDRLCGRARGSPVLHGSQSTMIEVA